MEGFTRKKWLSIVMSMIAEATESLQFFGINQIVPWYKFLILCVQDLAKILASS